MFSEWERMLDLVRELAGEMGVEAAWHTGSVPQDAPARRDQPLQARPGLPAVPVHRQRQRRAEPAGRPAPSSTVDLPWNPAKLEQRIARAWRKNQTRSVTVINLVTEDSIEHSMLHLLAQKQALADGVLDGQAT